MAPAGRIGHEERPLQLLLLLQDQAAKRQRRRAERPCGGRPQSEAAPRAAQPLTAILTLVLVEQRTTSDGLRARCCLRSHASPTSPCQVLQAQRRCAERLLLDQRRRVHRADQHLLRGPLARHDRGVRPRSSARELLLRRASLLGTRVCVVRVCRFSLCASSRVFTSRTKKGGLRCGSAQRASRDGQCHAAGSSYLITLGTWMLLGRPGACARRRVRAPALLACTTGVPATRERRIKTQSRHTAGTEQCVHAHHGAGPWPLGLEQHVVR